MVVEGLIGTRNRRVHAIAREEFEMIITDPELAFYLELEEFREVATAGAALSERIRWKVVRMVKVARIRKALQASDDRVRTGLRDGLERGGF
jgi:hypothetical protein